MYNELLLEGKLNPHLAEIEETAYDCFDRLTAQMAQAKKNIRYRGSLQNYLIDTGDEVILVDTGLPAGTPEEVPDENSPIFTEKDICSYMEAFAALGYMPEQVTKILLTHKHNDHSGELKPFPNAKICINADEIGAEELKGLSKRSSPSSRIITGLCCERRWNAFASKNACLVGHLSGRFQQDDGAVGLGGKYSMAGPRLRAASRCHQLFLTGRATGWPIPSGSWRRWKTASFTPWRAIPGTAAWKTSATSALRRCTDLACRCLICFRAKRISTLQNYRLARIYYRLRQTPLTPY